MRKYAHLLATRISLSLEIGVQIEERNVLDPKLSAVRQYSRSEFCCSREMRPEVHIEVKVLQSFRHLTIRHHRRENCAAPSWGNLRGLTFGRIEIFSVTTEGERETVRTTTTIHALESGEKFFRSQVDLLAARFVNHLGSPCHIGSRLIRPVERELLN